MVAGYFNTASGEYATVTGGDTNTASGQYASVSGDLFIAQLFSDWG